MRILSTLLITLLLVGACTSSKKTASETVETVQETAEEIIEVQTTASTDKSAEQIQWELDQPKILAYVEANNIDAQWLNSGLYYVILDEGKGKMVDESSEVEVNYSLSQLDGSFMWSTYKMNAPETYNMNNVIRAWKEGIPLIKEGGKIQLIVPSSLAYGAEGLEDNVPPNTNLVFDLELVKVN